MSVLQARRPGVCGNCRESISVGDKIDWTKEHGARHVSCAPAGAPSGDLKRAIEHLTAQRDAGRLDRFGKSLLEQWQQRGYLSERQVTAVCARLEDKPKIQVLPGPTEVPAGRYALILERDGVQHDFLVHVWRGTRNPDYVRAYEYDSGDRVDHFDALRRIVEQGPQQAAIRFGRLRGRCARCDARLSDKLSVELSVGPVCMKYWYTDAARKERKAEARSAIRARGEDPKGSVEQPIQLELEAV